MKTKITVLDGKGFAGRSKNKDGSYSNNWYHFYSAECIRYEMDDQGVERREVGVMRIPGDLCPIKGDEDKVLPALPAGDYIVEFKIKRDYKTREFLSAVAGLESVIARPQAPKDLAQPKA